LLKNNKYQLLSLLSLVGLVVGLFIGGSNWQPIAPGLPDAGPALTWFGQIAKLIFTGLGVIIFGRLVSITFLTRPDSLTKSLSRISVLANLWAVVAILTAIAQMSYVLGLNYQQIFSSGVISTYIFDLTSSRGYVISAVIAIAIAVIAIFVRNENTLFLLVVLTGAAIATPLLNSHAASLGDHSMALTSSVVHGIAVSAWVGTLIAVIPQIKAGDSPVVNRFGALAKWSVIALSLSGLAATYTRLDSPADFYQTGYGQLVLIKVTLFIMAVSLAGKIRSALAKNISLTKFLTFELAFLATAIGFGVALQNTALSRQSLPLPTAAEEILGFEFPPPPSIANYAFGWHPEWVVNSGDNRISDVPLCC
jgi:putative copper export protein